jgi:hypothetical protein
MRLNIHNNGNGANRLLGRLVAQKKKAVIASCLIGVMAFMWVKVLFKKTPQAAQATVSAKQAESNSQVNSQLKVSFIELPKVAGRNDVINRDFFDVGNWQEFVRDGEGGKMAIEEVNIPGEDGDKGIIRTLTEKLKLEAIELGKSARAFISGKLVTVGDKLFVSDVAKMYECEVVGIEGNAVEIRCGKAQVTLKLAQAVKVSR